MVQITDQTTCFVRSDLDLHHKQKMSRVTFAEKELKSRPLV